MDTQFERSNQTTIEWYTPPEIIRALGDFDLDPCSSEIAYNLNHSAKCYYTKEDNGLSKEWFGRIWLNPPYDQPTITRFIRRLAQHGNGIALLFNRCDNGGNNWEKRHFCIDKKRYSKKDQSKRTEWKYRISPHFPFATNSNRELLSDRNDQRTERRDQQDIGIKSLGIPMGWEKFPSQSPVCGGDDGIPDQLSDITVSRWITESTKAYGNTMVPQVVYEIFKFIEEIEKHSNI